MIRAVGVVTLVMLAPIAARADAQAEAVALFDQGIKEMRAGNFDKACPALAKSLALVSDSGTKGSLARCYEKSGKLASSWLLWRELADTAPTPDLRASAATNAKKLDARIPKYVIKLVAPTPNLTVTVNNKPVDPTIQVEIPVDPGQVDVVATAPNRFDWTTKQTAEEGKLLTIEVPELAILKADRPDVVDKPPPSPEDPPKPPPIADDPAAARRNRCTIGFTTIAFGGAALAGGVVFGVITRSRFSDAKTLCGGDVDHCVPDKVAAAQAKVDDARKAGTISTVLFAGSAALVALGIVVVVTAPSGAVEKRVTVAPTLGADGAGFAIAVSF